MTTTVPEKPTTTLTTSTTEKSTTTLTTTTTLATTTTTEAADSGASSCVLASTLSATFIILFFVSCGVAYYLYKKKKGKEESATLPQTGPNLPIKKGLNNDSSNSNSNPNANANTAYEPEHEYIEPPKREEPLPRKKKNKPPSSPYHTGAIADQEEYDVPPMRNDSFIKPPLPPNLVKKLRKEKEDKAKLQPNSDNADHYYLDMESIPKNDNDNAIYVNAEAPHRDDIYENH